MNRALAIALAITPAALAQPEFADFDDDGLLDIIMSDTEVALNLGDGTFSDPVRYLVLDADGFPKIMAAQDGALYVYFNDSGNGFSEPVIIDAPFAGITMGADAGPIDANASPDIVVGSADGVGLLFNLTCFADANGDGNLNALDFIAFQNGWVAKTRYTAFNNDGAYNVLDFIAFQAEFVAGCN